MLADLCWPGLFNKISFMKTISVLVLLQRNVHVQRQKSTLFQFENTKMWTCYRTCIRITYTVQTGILCFAELFEKGSEIRRKTRCFYLCVMSNAFIFDGFLSMDEICFFVFISKAVEWFWLISHSRMFFGNKFVWSSWENSLLKKCGCSRCQALWLVGENSWAFM